MSTSLNNLTLQHAPLGNMSGLRPGGIMPHSRSSAKIGVLLSTLAFTNPLSETQRQTARYVRSPTLEVTHTTNRWTCQSRASVYVMQHSADSLSHTTRRVSMATFHKFTECLSQKNRLFLSMPTQSTAQLQGFTPPRVGRMRPCAAGTSLKRRI